jgi:hypothetical protein
MAPLQDMALRLLASRHLIELQKLLNSIVERTDVELPSELSDLVLIRNEEDEELMAFLCQNFISMPLSGDQGLKARSNLLEHRYDAT